MIKRKHDLSVNKSKVLKLNINDCSEESKTLNQEYEPMVETSEIKQMRKIEPSVILHEAPIKKPYSQAYVGVSPLGPTISDSKSKSNSILNGNLILLAGVGILSIVTLVKILKLKPFKPLPFFLSKKINNKILILQVNCSFTTGDHIMLSSKHAHVKLGTIGVVVEKKFKPLKAVVDYSMPIKNEFFSSNYRELIKDVKGEGLRVILKNSSNSSKFFKFKKYLQKLNII